MHYHTRFAMDRRLIILQALAETSDRTLNERLLKRSLEAEGHNVLYDVIAGDVDHLVMIGAVKSTSPSGVLIAEILELGELHLSGGTKLGGVGRPEASRS